MIQSVPNYQKDWKEVFTLSLKSTYIACTMVYHYTECPKLSKRLEGSLYFKFKVYIYCLYYGVSLYSVSQIIKKDWKKVCI